MSADNSNNSNNNIELNEYNIGLNECNCCEGTRKLTPAKIWNQPGLSSLKYRVGTHAMFKASMLANISEKKALRNLTTRENDDFTIAMLDAWSSIADILTFYQERIANEGFLRTATERRSVLELARTIGYELRPGVAASTFLAFTIDDSGGSGISQTTIDVGTKVQSLPEAGQTPQVFETIEKIIARPEWNDLKPKTTKQQKLSDSLNSGRFVFKGTSKRLKVGDLLLIVTRGDNDDEDPESNLRVVSKVEEDNLLQQTEVEIDDVTPVDALPIWDYYGLATTLVGFVGENVYDPVPPDVTAKELQEFATMTGLTVDNYFAALNATRESRSQRQAEFRSRGKPEEEEGEVKFPPGVYVFRVKTGVFGHNAPKYEAKKNANGSDWVISEIQDIPINKTSGVTYPALIHLDNVYPSILQNSLVVIQSFDRTKTMILQVSGVIERSIANFSLSARVTGLKLKLENAEDDPFQDFKMRGTTIYAENEPLELAELPDDSPIEGDEILLSEEDIVEIEPGRLIAITGEPIGLPGTTQSEIAEIVEVNNNWENSSLTKITIRRAPSQSEVRYRRDTVTINANVAPATHGETTHEVLGSGDLSTKQEEKQQQFTLKQMPLTYIISPNSSTGAESTLDVRVDGILWDEVSSMYWLKPDDRAYVVRIQDDGTTRIIFGDGKRGMRPSAGAENITAEYRVGSGKSGMLKANQLSLLMSRPLGVRAATNPVAPNGADEPEKLEDARSNAPLQVLTMDRIVSLEDFENFARAFTGIGKAQAVWVWDEEKKIVRLTIASPEGNEIGEDLPTFEALKEAISAYKDPLIQVRIESFERKLFRVKAKIAVSPERRFEDVRIEVENRLVQRFSFESRQFNQPVAKSEVMAIIQRVKGVAAVDIDYLYTIKINDLIKRTIKRSLNDVLPESLEKGGVGRVVTVPKAWILFLLPEGVEIEEM